MLRDKAHLLDILEAAKLAVTYIENSSKEEFLQDTQCQDAVIRRFEIMGEAARRISDTTRTDHPKLPWNEMISMRNLMIHEYDGIDLNVVWRTVKNDLPGFISEVESIYETID